MGLGLFIAKTLLERSGAELSFANGADADSETIDSEIRSGAIVQARWPLDRIGAKSDSDRPALGENIPNLTA